MQSLLGVRRLARNHYVNRVPAAVKGARQAVCAETRAEARMGAFSIVQSYIDTRLDVNLPGLLGSGCFFRF